MPEKIGLNPAYAAEAGVLKDMGVILATSGVLWGKSA